MKSSALTKMVTYGFGLIQSFWIFWFFLLAGFAYTSMFLDWNHSGMPLDQFFIWTFELVWVGILPFVIICLTKSLVKRMMEKTLFTQEGYKLSLGILVLTGMVVLASLSQDFFYYQVSRQDLISFLDKYILHYLGAYLILMVLWILNLVIKNGLSVQDEMEGFI